MQKAIAVMATLRDWQQRYTISANGSVSTAGKGIGSLPLIEVKITSRKKDPQLMQKIATYVNAVGGTANVKGPREVRLNFDIQKPSAILTGCPRGKLGLKTQTAKMLKIHLYK